MLRQRAAWNAYPRPKTRTASAIGPGAASASARRTDSRSAFRSASQRNTALSVTPPTVTSSLPRRPITVASSHASAFILHAQGRAEGSDVQRETVVCELEVVRCRKFARAVRDEEPLRTRPLEGVDRFIEGEVPSGLTVELAAQEGRFTDEQIGISRRLHQLVGRGRVSGVRQDGAVRLDPEGVGLEAVVRDPRRCDRELADAERLVRLVLGEVERALEHVRKAQTLAEPTEELGTFRLYPERGLLHRP